MSKLNWELYDLIRASILIQRPEYSWNEPADLDEVVTGATLGAMIYIKELEEAIQHLTESVKRRV